MTQNYESKVCEKHIEGSNFRVKISWKGRGVSIPQWLFPKDQHRLTQRLLRAYYTP